MMLNIKVQRLKCYRNKKIKTEKLRNTNMLHKCRMSLWQKIDITALASYNVYVNNLNDMNDRLSSE